MLFTLTNEQRLNLGLELIKETWDWVQFSDNDYIIFDGDTIRKHIIVRDDFYYEVSLNELTTKNRTYISPKTSRGKEVKLTIANLDKRTGLGTYLLYNVKRIDIGNFTTQTTYFNSVMASVECNNFLEFKEWLNRWIETTTEKDLQEIKQFSSATRKHCKYKEGDYFRFSIDRGLFGYGRILLNYDRLRKENIKFWDILMGKPLVVKVYHIISTDPYIPISKIKSESSFPSQFIFDNIFYYGECEIIGNEQLDETELDYPIMYGRSISAIDPDKIIFQHGLVYKSLPYSDKELLGNYRNNGIGWYLHINRNILEKCIKTKSNQPYWEQNIYTTKNDLRNPENAEIKTKVFEQFNIK